jgi:hypothetical protein
MFPFLQSVIDQDFQHPSQHGEPSRRIDVQRHALEHKKMYHLNTMAVEQSFSDLDRRLATQRQVQLATEGRISLISRARHSLAAVLISTGQRVRPEAPLGEPRYNG